MNINQLSDIGWNNFFQSQLTLEALESQLAFRVVTVQRNLIECIGFDEDNQLKTLSLSTYFWRDDLPEDHPTVGDWVMLASPLGAQPEVVSLIERGSVIKRKGAGSESLTQLIAANIDTVFIVSSCNEEFNVNRIERYLSIAAESNIHCVLILTKTDLCEDPFIYRDQVIKSHPDLSIEMINATEDTSRNILDSWIGKGKTVALLGSSGVGKSTIVNCLMKDVSQETGGIRESDSKGRHTTTSRSLHFLSNGGILIDNPGMRELQIVDSEQGIKSTFSAIESKSEECRFTDCSHQTEPGCAVLKAVDDGEIEQRLLDNYHKLLAEHQRNSESIAERRSNDKALGKFYKTSLKSAMRFKSRE